MLGGEMAAAPGLPAYPDYVFPTLFAVRERGGSATIEEIEDGVAQRMGLSDEALAIPHGDTGRTEFQYKLAWVRTYLKKGGALKNSERGVWSLTELGERMTEQEARALFRRVGQELYEKRKQAETARIDTPAEEPIAEEPEESWIERLLALIGSMQPDGFERLSQRLLRESGFTKVEVTGRPSDGGIDGIGVLRMNLVSFQVLFQCKRWKGSVGASVVRDFRGAMVGRADKGLIITTGTFTADARREATRDGAPAIDLIDGETLCLLLKERRLGVGIRMVEEIDLDAAFFNAI
jgi:restriction system protein